MYLHAPSGQQTTKEAMRFQSPLGEEQRIITSALCVDTEGKHVGFSAYTGLPLERDLVQLPGVTWYSVIDVTSKKLIIAGPRQTAVPQRVQDYVIGWSHHLIIVRNRLLHAGSPFPEDVDEHYKVLDREVSVIAVSNKGDEQLIRRYTCPHHPALQPVLGASGYLDNFHLCRHRDCLVFTEDKTVFRKEPSLVRKGRWLTVPDVAKSRQVVHRVHLHTGKDEVIGETPNGWRCEHIWYDCQSGRVAAIVSTGKNGERMLGVASSNGGSPIRVLGLANDARGGKLSPDGKLAVFTNGDAHKDVSTVKIVRANAPSVVLWKGVVPGWRRKSAWSGDSRKVLLWYSIWFHDREQGRKYQRLYQGYRFWIADIAGKNACAVGPEWAGVLSVTWGPDNKGLFVIANGTLGYLNMSSGKVDFIWAFPAEWYKTQ